MNRGYLRSRAKETFCKNLMEKSGYYCIRSAGSKGKADIVCMLPQRCGNAFHYDVKFIQIKVSENIKKGGIISGIVKTRWFPINLEVWKFPVKSKKWQKKYSKKAKKLQLAKKLVGKRGL